MNRPKIVAGNWKMNKLREDALELAEKVAEQSKAYNDVQKILFPPFPFLQMIGDVLGKTKVQDLFVGAQNCSEHSAGAYTGEVSAAMLKSLGCSHVIIGHSERRQYFNETNLIASLKIKQTLSNDLTPVYCIGERLEERKSDTHFSVVKTQLHEALSLLSKEQIKNCILAYEPVWAIGTGETASPQQAQEMHAYIRSVIAELFDAEIAAAMPILYGGSCNPQNAKELFACADVDGGLIGGASLKADDFCKIMASF